MLSIASEAKAAVLIQGWMRVEGFESKSFDGIRGGSVPIQEILVFDATDPTSLGRPKKWRAVGKRNRGPTFVEQIGASYIKGVADGEDRRHGMVLEEHSKWTSPKDSMHIGRKKWKRQMTGTR